MKTKTITCGILVLLMVAFAFLSSTAASNPAQNCAEKMWNKLSESVKYPDFAVKEKIEGQVTVVFTITETGHISIKDVVTDEPRLAAFIKEELAGLECSEMLKAAGIEFKVRFRFHFI